MTEIHGTCRHTGTLPVLWIMDKSDITQEAEQKDYRPKGTLSIF